MENKPNAKKIVESFGTVHRQGFTRKELTSLIDHYNIDENSFYEHLTGCTGMIIDGDFVTYHCDVETALRCCFERRDMKPWEFD